MAVVVLNETEARCHIGVLRTVALGLERALSGATLPVSTSVDIDLGR